MIMTKQKYVLVGTGSRSSIYINALCCEEFKEYGELLAVCDTNQTRMNYWLDYIGRNSDVKLPAAYKAADFDRMIAEQKPDKVIVTSIDRTHHTYICRAMELGCDVVTEKPMTVDADKCRQIFDTQKRTGRNITVAFNYRYAPRNTKVKELLSQGIAGTVASVTFEWLLDTRHGADYFRRWQRDKRNSGGLLVHKSTHHFDLMNWWLNSAPMTVYAMGDLKFYGRENAEKRGITEFYSRARNSEIARKDPFALQLDPVKDEMLMGLYYNAEHEDGYYRDRSVFSDGISIEDNMNVMVRYENGTVMNYCQYAHSPWEGYRVCFNGTKGRLEYNVVSQSYVSGDYRDFNQPGARELEQDKSLLVPEIIFQPLWGKPQVISCDASGGGGHGGGDIRMLSDIFKGAGSDPLTHAANHIDGAKSILTGIAANESIRTGMPVTVADLIK